MSRSTKQLVTAADIRGGVAVNPSAIYDPATEVSGTDEFLSSDVETTSPCQGVWLLNTVEAAKYLGLSPHTLSKWRITGKGPPFQLLGRRCLYSPEVLRRWSETKIRKSTSDPGTEAA